MIKETTSHHLLVTDTLDIDFWQRPTKVFLRASLNFHFDVSLSQLSEHQNWRPEQEIEKRYFILILYFQLW